MSENLTRAIIEDGIIPLKEIKKEGRHYCEIIGNYCAETKQGDCYDNFCPRGYQIKETASIDKELLKIVRSHLRRVIKK